MEQQKIEAFNNFFIANLTKAKELLQEYELFDDYSIYFHDFFYRLSLQDDLFGFILDGNGEIKFQGFDIISSDIYYILLPKFGIEYNFKNEDDFSSSVFVDLTYKGEVHLNPMLSWTLEREHTNLIGKLIKEYLQVAHYLDKITQEFTKRSISVISQFISGFNQLIKNYMFKAEEFKNLTIEQITNYLIAERTPSFEDFFMSITPLLTYLLPQKKYTYTISYTPPIENVNESIKKASNKLEVAYRIYNITKQSTSTMNVDLTLEHIFEILNNIKNWENILFSVDIPLNTEKGNLPVIPVFETLQSKATMKYSIIQVRKLFPTHITLTFRLYPTNTYLDYFTDVIKFYNTHIANLFIKPEDNVPVRYTSFQSYH